MGNEDFLPSVGLGLFSGLISLVIIGFFIGLAAGYLGWIWGGALFGGLITLTFSFLVFMEDGDILSLWQYLLALTSCLAGLALLTWLFSWFPFGVNSFGALEWFIGAVVGMLVMAGLIVSFAFWVRRPSAPTEAAKAA